MIITRGGAATSETAGRLMTRTEFAEALLMENNYA
jgi:hypothetical protein